MASSSNTAQPTDKKRKPDNNESISNADEHKGATTRSAMEVLLAESEGRMLEAIGNAAKSTEASTKLTISTEFGKTLLGYDKQVCERFDETNDRIAALSRRIDTLEGSSRSQIGQVEAIAK